MLEDVAELHEQVRGPIAAFVQDLTRFGDATRPQRGEDFVFPFDDSPDPSSQERSQVEVFAHAEQPIEARAGTPRIARLLARQPSQEKG